MNATLMKCWSTAIIGIVFFALMKSAAAENWPNWRGPRSNGTSLETNLPVKWSKTEDVL